MIPMMEGERVVWSGRKGMRYRMFLLTRDLVFLGALMYALYVILSTQAFSFFGHKEAVYIGLFLFGALVIGVRQISFLFLSYQITTERVLIIDGFFSRRMISIKHENIRDTKLVQSFPERLLGVGNVYIFTSNDSGEHAEDAGFLQQVPCLHIVDNPLSVHVTLETLCEKV